MTETYKQLHQEAKKYIGLSLEEAEKLAEQENKIIRLVRIDDKPLIGTCDWILERINVSVKNNKVVDVGIG